MKQYEMLLAEIERRKKVLTVLGEGCIVGQRKAAEYNLLCELEEFAKGLTSEVTSEISEDLEKELSEVWKDWATEYAISFVSYKQIAKHFFELGMNKSLTKDDVNRICQLFMEREAIERYFPDSIEWIYEQLNK